MVCRIWRNPYNPPPNPIQPHPDVQRFRPFGAAELGFCSFGAIFAAWRSGVPVDGVGQSVGRRSEWSTEPARIPERNVGRRPKWSGGIRAGGVRNGAGGRSADQRSTGTERRQAAKISEPNEPKSERSEAKRPESQALLFLVAIRSVERAMVLVVWRFFSHRFIEWNSLTLIYL